jgi:hypothetical protein
MFLFSPSTLPQNFDAPNTWMAGSGPAMTLHVSLGCFT